jgi:putative Mn2+ efflux pump MntP
MSLLAALLLGTDSFVVSCACGPLRTGRWARLRLALAFAACDALALLVGAGLVGAGLQWRFGAWGHAPVPIVIAGAALCLFLATAHGKRVSGRLLFALPVLLSFDNLVFGAAGGPLSLRVAANAGMLGMASGVMALAGLALGGAASRLTRTPAQRWAAVGLLAASCVLFLG